MDIQHPGRSRTVRSIDNIESARQDVTHNPQKSLRGRSEDLQIFKTYLLSILKEDLKCYPYKIQFVQKIDQSDYEKRFQFVRLVIEIFQKEVNMCFLLMTDEAHFHLNGFINKQNFRYWRVENPRIANEKDYIHNV